MGCWSLLTRFMVNIKMMNYEHSCNLFSCLHKFYQHFLFFFVSFVQFLTHAFPRKFCRMKCIKSTCMR